MTNYVREWDGSRSMPPFFIMIFAIAVVFAIASFSTSLPHMTKTFMSGMNSGMPTDARLAALGGDVGADETTTTEVQVPLRDTDEDVARSADRSADNSENPNSGNVETGIASWYDYKPGGCAHVSLPKGTVVTVTNLDNGKSTTCVVNDRGPYVAGRIIDLETRVFKEVEDTSRGLFSAKITW